MPWLGSVAAVLEAWYPGQVGGTALDAVLSGAVDPSGLLPVAFPTSDATAPMVPPHPWPNPNPTADLVGLGDLGVGSRWYAAHGVTPLFPFGFGLSYTTFSVGALRAHVSGGVVRLSVTVTNTEGRSGRYTALADVTAPSASGEPAGELKAFGGVSIPAHRSTSLSLAFSVNALNVWQGNWQLVPGRYTVTVGGRATAFTLSPSP